jgi:hypothetical protein
VADGFWDLASMAGCPGPGLPQEQPDRQTTGLVRDGAVRNGERLSAPPGATQSRHEKENIMKAAVETMEAQLKLWGLKIDDLATATMEAGVRARFEDLMHIDELKALYAIAQMKFEEFKAAGNGERRRRKAEMRRAWNELDAAFKNPKPSG